MTTDDPFAEYRTLEFMESRVPVLPALRTFVPENTQPHPEVTRELTLRGQHRWYPVAGGHRVLVLYEGGAYDAAQFTLEPDAWDHDHCDRCRGRIPAMTLCWVTRTGRYVTLCVDCKKGMDAK